MSASGDQALRDRIEVLERHVRFQERFLSMVAHDVLTPPVVLQGFAELLLRDRYGPLNDAQKRTAGKIHANVEKLVGMMEQLLAFSRLLKRLREAAPGSVPVVGVLEREATRIRKEAFSPKLVLSVGENMGDACVAADEAGLAFLIRNVLHNVACLAETDGAVEVRLDRGRGRCRLRLRFNVDPSGLEKPNRTLEAFFMQRAGFAEDGQKPGMPGLAAAVYLAHLHSGRIDLEADDEGKAVLTLEMPLK